MPEKQFTAWLQHWGEWITLAWVVGLSMLGGAVNYLQRLRRSNVRLLPRVLVIELVTSGFVGLMAYWLCQSAHLSGSLTAVMVGISGHMGTRAIYRFERVFARLLGDEREP